MTWTLRIPYQHPDESLIDTASHCRKLGQDDARVMRQIVTSALIDGVAKSAGELIDHLEKLAPGERRALLDQARLAAGLPGTEDVERHQRKRALITRVDVDPSLQACHHKGCEAIPTTSSGAWRPVNVRRWRCTDHEHLAEPGDMTDQGSGLKLSPSGVPVPAGLDDQREQAAVESHRAQQQARQADRDADAAAQAEHERGKRDQLRRELPEHLRSTV